MIREQDADIFPEIYRLRFPRLAFLQITFLLYIHLSFSVPERNLGAHFIAESGTDVGAGKACGFIRLYRYFTPGIDDQRMPPGMIGCLHIPGRRGRNHKALRIDCAGAHEQFPVKRSGRRVEGSRNQDQLHALPGHLHEVRRKTHIEADRKCRFSEFGIEYGNPVSRGEHVRFPESLAGGFRFFRITGCPAG